MWYKESLHAPAAAQEAIEQFTDLAVNGLNEDELAHPVMFAAYTPELNGTAIQLFRWRKSIPSLSTLPIL